MPEISRFFGVVIGMNWRRRQHFVGDLGSPFLENSGAQLSTLARFAQYSDSGG
jgi:hypothetical protein